MAITKEYLLSKQAVYRQSFETARAQTGVYNGAIACIDSILKDLEDEDDESLDAEVPADDPLDWHGA